MLIGKKKKGGGRSGTENGGNRLNQGIQVKFKVIGLMQVEQATQFGKEVEIRFGAEESVFNEIEAIGSPPILWPESELKANCLSG